MLNQILEISIKNMAIKTTSDYVKFYINLDMQNSVSFSSFINNEKMVLKHKLENKKSDKEAILNGIRILEELVNEIKKNGEQAILEKYSD
jgi:flagellar motor switch protein FliG